MSLLTRFATKFDLVDECWEWNAGRFGGGYGAFCVDGQNRLAHRVAYEQAVGPIPEGMQLDHLCRNRACVNPDHLEPVTPKENTARGLRANSLKTNCKHGHPFNEENTGIYRGRRYCRACHREGQRVRRTGGSWRI